ncbi:LamG-like jellyroll fold domain-containing protein [Verrucomicrobiota bacterium]
MRPDALKAAVALAIIATLAGGRGAGAAAVDSAHDPTPLDPTTTTVPATTTTEPTATSTTTTTTTITTTTTTTTTFAPNLVCWLKFDEGGGSTAFDSSGHNNHAEFYPWGTQTHYEPAGGPVLPGNPAITLDAVEFETNAYGADQALTITDSASMDSVMARGTIVLWITKGDFVNDRAILGNHPQKSGLLLYHEVYHPEELYMSFDGNGFPQYGSGAHHLSSDWTHVAVTWNQNEVPVRSRMYFNGAFVNYFDSSINMPNPGDWRLGFVHQCGDNWDGRMADFALYNEPLSAADIYYIYQYGVEGREPEPVVVPTGIYVTIK